MEALQAEQRIACYRLIKLLGEGGMGEVWLAHDEPADRSVALKFIKPHLLSTPGMRMRFTNEARTLGKLDHDRIVTLYAVLEEGEHLAFVLRYVEGESLADRIDTRGSLPMPFVLSSARDILSALGEAHQHGIIHRDMKPQNILLDRRDRSFLTDFGIAVTDFLQRATIGAQPIGTPHYMSPEQITRPQDLTIAKGGQRTDIYSYGVVLYEMLTGQVPFGKDLGPEQIFTIQQAHCQQVPQPLRVINDLIPPAMEQVVLHCLEKNPDDRPQNCADLLAEIEAAAGAGVSQPLVSRPRTVIEQPSQGAGAPSQLLPAEPAPHSTPPALSKKSTPLQRNLLLGSAGLALAAGLGFTLYTVTGSHKSENAPGFTSPTNATGNLVPTEGTSTRPGGGNTPQPLTPVKKVGGKTDNNASAGTSRNVPSGTQLPQPVPQLSNDAKEAETLYREAKQEYAEGEYCAASGNLNKAIALNPGATRYTSLQKDYKDGCANQHN